VSRVLRFVSVKTSLLVGYLGVTVLCGVLVAALALPVIAVVAYGTSRAAAGIQTLPEQLAKPQLQGFTNVYDRNNKVIATFFQKNQQQVPLTAVAPVMRQAVVDIEDKRFYEHGAADAQGILRALASNQVAGGTVAGGSTLTQQYVKNTLVALANGDPAKVAAATATSNGRKLQELRYAIGVEKVMTKDQILGGYLNIATFGQSVYGVQAAALYYFGVPASRLTLPQAAMIAGMTKEPNALDPTGPVLGLQDPRRLALARRNVVLDTMHALHHITDAQWQAARRSPLGVINGGQGQSPQRGCLSTVADWYCDYVQNLVLKSPDFAVLGATRAQRETAFTSGGLTIRTALDAGIQGLVDNGLHSQANATDKPVAATAVVRPGTGEVLSVASSKTLRLGARGPRGSTTLNYAVEQQYGSSIGYQPGSTMKAFTAAAALADGQTLDTVIDAPYRVDFTGQRFPTCSGSVTSPSYKPVNSSPNENGPITMNTALQESVNTYFLLLEQQVGICKPWQLATAAGLTRGEVGLKAPKPFYQVPSFTLGVDQTSALQMSAAYAMFGAGGVYCKPLVITSIVRDGRTVYDKGPDCKRLMPKGVADAVAWSLYHNVQGDQGVSSTARGLGIPGVPYAAKTGTTDDSKAVWYNGFNSQFASSMMIGDSTSGSNAIVGEQLGGTRIPKGASGASVAGQVWLAVMKPVLQAQSDHPGFVDPDPQFGGQTPGRSFLDLFNSPSPSPTTSPTSSPAGPVPDVVGMSRDMATATLQAQGFTVLTGAQRYPDNGAPAGQVIRTYPSAGANAVAGSTVIVYVSQGTGSQGTGSQAPSPSPGPTGGPQPTTSPTPNPAPTASPVSVPTSPSPTQPAPPTQPALPTQPAPPTGQPPPTTPTSPPPTVG